MIAGTTPMRTSVKAKVASAGARAMSAAATRPIPPARAGPLRRATTGLGPAMIRSKISGSSGAGSTGSPLSAAPTSLRSAPALKTGPVPVSTTARTSSSSIAAPRASKRPARSRADRALRLRGESRVIVATARSTLDRTSGVSSEGVADVGCCVIANSPFSVWRPRRPRSRRGALVRPTVRGCRVDHTLALHGPRAPHRPRTHEGRGPRRSPALVSSGHLPRAARDNASEKWSIEATASAPSAASLTLRVRGSAVTAPV